jgi:hypothetical protein
MSGLCNISSNVLSRIHKCTLDNYCALVTTQTADLWFWSVDPCNLIIVFVDRSCSLAIRTQFNLNIGRYYLIIPTCRSCFPLLGHYLTNFSLSVLVIHASRYQNTTILYVENLFEISVLRHSNNEISCNQPRLPPPSEGALRMPSNKTFFCIRRWIENDSYWNSISVIILVV